MKRGNRYAQIIEEIFFLYYQEGAVSIEFEREDIRKVAEKHGIDLPLNLGDVIYSFRYRASLPVSIIAKAPEEYIWIIRPAGRSRYRFVAVKQTPIIPNTLLAEIKIPDSTPGIVNRYSMNDEQALLAKIRYNRLIDIFTGVTSFSLQNHLRTTVTGIGQVETDEIYVGLDRRGVHYVFPVQAKGGTDKLSIVQIEQDIALCNAKFKKLVCLAIGAQWVGEGVIALLGFHETDEGVRLHSERHYRIVPPDDITEEDLARYRGVPLVSDDILGN